MKKIIRSSLLAILVTGPLAGLAFAHSGATGIVKERMELMKTIGDAMKGLATEVKARDAGDPERIRLYARTIEEHGGERMLELFPEGSAVAPSEAVPLIWEDWDRFQKIAEDLKAQAEAVRESPGDMVAFAELAGTCKACHADFRQKK